MASTSRTGVEIRKFDGKNFALWKEMMQDVPIIRRQIEAIRHNKQAAMVVDEWHSLDEIARSTIRMHLIENVYFNMAKVTTTFALWESYRPFTENNPPHQNSYWSDNCSIWRWERQNRQPPTLMPSVGCYPNSSPKGLTSTKKWKPLPYSGSYRQVGRWWREIEKR